ncbi:MAG: serine acetyltransferase [Planctomycetes bacterium]|nr:serine acetyltransferase [Planctomycetota bacterium]
MDPAQAGPRSAPLPRGLRSTQHLGPRRPHVSDAFEGLRCRPLEQGLIATWREDYAAHGRDASRPGFRAVAVHRFGVWRMGIRSKWIRAPFSVLYRFLERRIRNRYGIELAFGCHLGRRVVIEHQSAIVIHGSSFIGDDSILRQGVTLGMRSVDDPFAAPTLGQRVDVGAGAKILGPVQIGDDAKIGANAVVLIDVPAGALAVGVPAKVKTREGVR